MRSEGAVTGILPTVAWSVLLGTLTVGGMLFATEGIDITTTVTEADQAVQEDCQTIVGSKTPCDPPDWGDVML